MGVDDGFQVRPLEPFGNRPGFFDKACGRVERRWAFAGRLLWLPHSIPHGTVLNLHRHWRPWRILLQGLCLNMYRSGTCSDSETWKDKQFCGRISPTPSSSYFRYGLSGWPRSDPATFRLAIGPLQLADNSQTDAPKQMALTRHQTARFRPWFYRA